MRAEILTIGDELCRGEIIDTNSSWLADKLWELDVTVTWMSSCRDTEADMRRAVNDAVGRTDLVLISGGLGPTIDDITVDVVSAAAGVEVVEDTAARTRMEKRYAAANFEVTPNNLRQVRVPEGSRAFGNAVGAAPGFEILVGGVPVVCMPGIPREMYRIFEDSVRDRIVELRESRGERIERIARRIFRVFGQGESHIAAALEGLVSDVQGASLHYQVKFPETLVKVVVRDADAALARARLEEIDLRVREKLGPRMYGIDSDSLAASLGKKLLASGSTLATAESCTGGMVGALITAVPGSSSYYVGGAVTYSNAEKIRQLHVDADMLEEHGAVSEESVKQMALGARHAFGSDFAVAVSGIAGPGGGSADKPVGTVWLAVVGADEVYCKRFMWPGARDQVRSLAAHWALALVSRQLDAAARAGAKGGAS